MLSELKILKLSRGYFYFCLFQLVLSTFLLIRAFFLLHSTRLHSFEILLIEGFLMLTFLGDSLLNTATEGIVSYGKLQLSNLMDLILSFLFSIALLGAIIDATVEEECFGIFLIVFRYVLQLAQTASYIRKIRRKKIEVFAKKEIELPEVDFDDEAYVRQHVDI